MAGKYTKWTVEILLEKIKGLWDSGEDLRPIAVRQNHHKILSAGIKRFETWYKACNQAGISKEQIKQRFEDQEKQKYLQELRDAYEDGVPLNAGHLQQNSDRRGLYDRAKRFYSGKLFWETALEQAELPVGEIVKERGWDEKRVKARLLERKTQGKPLNVHAVTKEESGLVKAAERLFGSYDDALRSSGLNPKKIRMSRTYTDLEIILKIIECKNRGDNLGPKSISRIRKKGRDLKRVYSVAGKRFGNWRKALEIAGVDPSEYYERKRWNPEKVREEILRIFEAGEALNAESILQNQKGLYNASRRHCGSWEQAVGSCGIDYKNVTKKPRLSIEQIVEGIQDLNSKGKRLDCTGVVEDEDIAVRRLLNQSRTKFERGWEEALELAGIDPKGLVCRRKAYTLEELAKIVRDAEQEGINLVAKEVARHPELGKIFSAVQKRYSTWYDFLEEIGIDSSKYTVKQDWKKGENVILALQERFPSGLVCRIRQVDKNLHQASLVYFGGIGQAAEAAGLVYSKYGKISKRLLEEKPETLGILYRCNRGFLLDIVKRVYYGALVRSYTSLEIEELEQEALSIFLDEIPKKPAKTDLRVHVYTPVYEGLIKKNREHGIESREYIEGQEFTLSV
jgi:hypothetical protein